ncbi:hypothetical protein PFISCL1PPCAC_1105, partial [Pristionchus fissidentatus]
LRDRRSLPSLGERAMSQYETLDNMNKAAPKPPPKDDAPKEQSAKDSKASKKNDKTDADDPTKETTAGSCEPTNQNGPQVDQIVMIFPGQPQPPTNWQDQKLSEKSAKPLGDDFEISKTDAEGRTEVTAKSQKPAPKEEKPKEEPKPAPPVPPPPPQQIVVKIEQPKTQPTSSDPPKSEEAPKKKKCCP